jgi:hypothetical protein
MSGAMSAIGGEAEMFRTGESDALDPSATSARHSRIGGGRGQMQKLSTGKFDVAFSSQEGQ